ncbi:MAG: MFS transporter, partial [Flavobacterium sp.]
MITSKNSPETIQKTIYSILFIISFSHFINDLLQAVIPSVYPLFKEKFNLTFAQIGMITFTYQLTASILQPFVGIYTDKKSKPYSLIIGMSFTLLGLLVASIASNLTYLLLAVSLIGIGSSIFHPESFRVAHLASGGKKGLAQSIYQLGGSAGSAIGPLLAALIIIPNGQSSVVWFCLIALIGIFALYKIAIWYSRHLETKRQNKELPNEVFIHKLSKKKIAYSLIILLVLIFSKYFYLASITSYYTFFLIDKFNVSIQVSQIYLFAFLGAVAAGTLLGGPLGDKFGRKYI